MRSFHSKSSMAVAGISRPHLLPIISEPLRKPYVCQLFPLQILLNMFSVWSSCCDFIQKSGFLRSTLRFQRLQIVRFFLFFFQRVNLIADFAGGRSHEISSCELDLFYRHVHQRFPNSYPVAPDIQLDSYRTLSGTYQRNSFESRTGAARQWQESFHPYSAAEIWPAPDGSAAGSP